FLKLPAPETEAKLAKFKSELEQTSQQLTNFAATVLQSGQDSWEEGIKAAAASVSEAKSAKSEAATNDLQVTPEILAIVRKPSGERTVEETKQVQDFRLEHHPERLALAQRVKELQKQIKETDLSIPITLVMEEMAEPRPTFVLVRGAYDKKAEPVSAATP